MGDAHDILPVRGIFVADYRLVRPSNRLLQKRRWLDLQKCVSIVP